MIMCMETVVKIAPALRKIREEKLAIFDGLIPSDRQLDSYAEMLPPLLLVKKYSEMLEREKSPTIHLVIPILQKLSSFSKSSNFRNIQSTTAKALIEAFEQSLASRAPDQGRQISVVAMANVLHPFYKGSLLNKLGKDYYDETIQAIKDFFPEVNPQALQTPEVLLS